RKFESEITVTPDAKVDVTENITFQFKGGPWHGVYRIIPVEYVGPSGLNYSLFLEVKSITDGNGVKLKFESSRVDQNRKLKIYIPTLTIPHRPLSLNMSSATLYAFSTTT